MGAVLYLCDLPTEEGLCREIDVSEVDRISHALGQLMAEAEESRRQRETMYAKLDRLEREHIEISGMMRRHMEDSQRARCEDKERYERLVEPTLADYRKLKNRAIGVMAIIAALGAAAIEIFRAIGAKWGLY